MNRTSILFASLTLAGCLGGYQGPGDPMTDPPVDPGQNQNPPPANPPPSNPPPVAQDGGVPPGPSNAKPQFDANVAPILAASCAGGACHSPPGTSPIRFNTTLMADLYDSVLIYGDKLVASTFDKTKAQVLLKIQAGHYGVTYSSTQRTAIESWLDAEVAARAGGGGLMPSPGRKLMAEWSGCMKLTDWETEQVALQWANKGSNQGPCKQCHVNGQGWLASEDSQRVFNILTTQPNAKTGGMFMEYYFIPDLTTDPANPKMIINRALIQRAASGNAQHPLFTVDGNAYSALTRFYDKAMAHKTAKTCDPPKFTP